MKLLLTVAAFVLTSASLAYADKSAQEELASPTEAVFVGYKLSLHDRDGQCVLVANDKLDVILKLKSSCQFHRDKLGKLRVSMTGKNPVFLIEHSTKMPPPNKDCDTQVQAVRSVNGKLEASVPMVHVTTCPPFQWDQKVFDGLFPHP